MTVLHHFGSFIRSLFVAIDLSIVRGAFVFVYVALIVWIASLPRTATTPPDRPGKIHEDLRLWACLAAIIQIAIYAFI